MKVIISHDIDHLSASEHFRDLVIPKDIARTFIEYGLGHILASEVRRRLCDIGRNKLHNLDTLLKFDKVENIPSTFFVAVSRGKGLAYGLQHASFWIRAVMEEGFDVGLHGIAYKNVSEIRQEWTLFKELSGSSDCGIRMHYLRCDENTLQNLREVGYVYDSSVESIDAPYRVGTMWEFPVHIMDGRVFCVRRRWQNETLTGAIDRTKRLIDHVYSRGIDYCTVVFHDMHFSDSYRALKEWYVWLMKYLKDNNISFSSFKEAVAELKRSHGHSNIE